MLFQLPDETGAGDKVLGNFIVTMMSLGAEWDGSFWYGTHTQPPSRNVIEKLKGVLSHEKQDPGVMRQRYECNGNGARYIVDFSVESEPA